MQFLFIDSSTPLSRRDHELRDQEARSHAAKISHQRAVVRIKAKSRASSSDSTVTQSSLAESVEYHISKASCISLNEHELDDSDSDSDPNVHQCTANAMALLSPQSILIQGQSDPFNALPIRIDAKVHQLLMYFQSHTVFHRHRVTAKTWTLSQSALADWQDTRQSLEDQGRGYALLAQISAVGVLETSSSQLAVSSLSYVQKSTATLRKRLESKEDDWDSCKLWRHIGLLQNAELLIRNREATVVHGKMLRCLFDRWVASGRTLDLRPLLHAVYVDVHMAITFLIRPNFEPSAKLIAQFPEISSNLLREVSAVSASSMRPNIDEQIAGTPLRNIFLKWEQYHFISSFYGRRLWTFMMQLQLVNYLLDTEEVLNQQPHFDDMVSFHAQAYLSLAALYFVRVTTLPEHFNTIPLFKGHTNILERLRYHLEVSDIIDDGYLYFRARLWALFVGAHSEHQATALFNRSHLTDVTSKAWFSVRLVQQARRCGLLGWIEIKEVLEDFMYRDVLPDPSEWYTALLFSGEIWSDAELEPKRLKEADGALSP